MNKSWGFDTPEIPSLILRCGGVRKAEFCLGIEAGLLGKIRNGKHTYSPMMKARVLDALSCFPTRKGNRMAAKQKEKLNVPSDIQQLIDRHGSAFKAEKAANIGHGAFGTISRGSIYTDDMKTRVKAALDGQPLPKKTIVKAPPTISDSCPPLLADLIKAKGSRAGAAEALGVSNFVVKAVMDGRKMPSDWTIKAKAALGLPVIASAPPASVAAPAGPPFVPWDGKSKGTFKTRAHGKAKARVIKDVPQPILDLLKKHSDIVQRASSAAGITGNTLFKWMEGLAFTDDRQRVVHAAMHGLPTGMSASMGEEFDKYKLGIAICLLKGANFDRIAELADVLNGVLVFRKNTTAGWIVIYGIPSVADLMRFKRLALRDANEIVCP